MHSTFSGNKGSVATLVLFQSNVTMFNCTFSNNKHAESGGISLNGGSLQILDSFFEDNRGGLAIACCDYTGLCCQRDWLDCVTSLFTL